MTLSFNELSNLESTKDVAAFSSRRGRSSFFPKHLSSKVRLEFGVREHLSSSRECIPLGDLMGEEPRFLILEFIVKVFSQVHERNSFSNAGEQHSSTDLNRGLGLSGRQIRSDDLDICLNMNDLFFMLNDYKVFSLIRFVSLIHNIFISF